MDQTQTANIAVTPLPEEATAARLHGCGAAKVGELIREEANPNLKLRVFVQGGGCSGFQYGFTFDENVGGGRHARGNQGVTLLVDPMSIQYLTGAEIDYREDIEGAQFVIRNPNAATTCGCGSSFSDVSSIQQLARLLPVRIGSAAKSRTSSPRSIWAPTVSTWSSPVIRTGSSSSSIVCARWCVWPQASTSRIG